MFNGVDPDVLALLFVIGFFVVTLAALCAVNKVADNYLKQSRYKGGFINDQGLSDSEDEDGNRHGHMSVPQHLKYEWNEPVKDPEGTRYPLLSTFEAAINFNSASSSLLYTIVKWDVGDAGNKKARVRFHVAAIMAKKVIRRKSSFHPIDKQVIADMLVFKGLSFDDLNTLKMRVRAYVVDAGIIPQRMKCHGEIYHDLTESTLLQGEEISLKLNFFPPAKTFVLVKD